MLITVDAFELVGFLVFCLAIGLALLSARLDSRRARRTRAQ